jgi:hypothetical protein
MVLHESHNEFLFCVFSVKHITHNIDFNIPLLIKISISKTFYESCIKKEKEKVDGVGSPSINL